MRKDYPDDKLVRELNQKYGEDDLELNRMQKKRKLFIKIAAFFIFLMFLLGTVGRTVEYLSFPSLDFLHDSIAYLQEPHIREQREAVVELQVVSRDEGKVINVNRRGTGFHIEDEGLIVTNRHVVENARYVSILFPGRAKYAGGEPILSLEYDLAIIEIKENGLTVGREEEALPLPSLPMEYSRMPLEGERVTIIGNPLQMSRVVVKGKVLGYRPGSHDSIPGIMKIDAPVHPGNSGSPVINKHGKVVGIVFATTTGGSASNHEKIGLAVPAGALPALINKLSGQRD